MGTTIDLIRVLVVPEPTQEDLFYFSGISSMVHDGVRIINRREIEGGVDIIIVLEDAPSTIRYQGNPIKIYLSAETAWDFDDVSQEYHQRFLNQFDLIYSPHPYHLLNQISSPPFLPWMIGGDHGNYKYNRDMSYEKLMTSAMVPKDANRLVSCIVSNQDWKIGHRQRNKFIWEIKKYFGDIITTYGRGAGNPVRSKWDAISPHKYHICIENQQKNNVLTEKILDPFLGFSIPLYDGAINIDEYFPVDSLVRIDINDLTGSIREIKRCIDGDFFGQHEDRLLQARSIVLDRFSIYKQICAISKEAYKKKNSLIGIKYLPYIKPRCYFVPKQRQLQEYLKEIKYRVKNAPIVSRWKHKA